MQLNTTPLSQIELRSPVLADGSYHAKIVKKEVRPNTAKTGNNLFLEFQVVDPILTKLDGSQVENSGNATYTRFVSLVPTAKYDPNKALKELALALKLPADKENFELEDIQGYVIVKMKYRPAEGQYQESNDIAGFLPVEDTFSPAL